MPELIRGDWTVRAEGATPYELLATLREKGKRIDRLVLEAMFVQWRFSAVRDREYRLAAIDPDSLPPEQSRVRDMVSAAAQLGAHAPPLEVALLMAAKYTPQQLGCKEAIIFHPYVRAECGHNRTRTRAFRVCIGSYVGDDRDIRAVRAEGANRFYPGQRAFFLDHSQ